MLENAGIRFEARAAEIDERAIEDQLEKAGASPETVALILAEAKARDVGAAFPDAIVIGSDQTMSLGQRVFTSRKDMDEAARPSDGRCPGKTHRLNSAVVADAAAWNPLGHMFLRAA